jgi:hypothetical protein
VGVDEQPPDVRVQQPAQRTAPAMAVVDVRTVRVALPIGERMMLAMVGHPRDDRALDRRRAKDREHSADRARGLERAVSEQAVKAHRHTEAGKHVQQQEHEDVVPAQQTGPQLPANEEQTEDRDGGDNPSDDPVTSLADHRLDVVLDGSR